MTSTCPWRRRQDARAYRHRAHWKEPVNESCILSLSCCFHYSGNRFVCVGAFSLAPLDRGLVRLNEAGHAPHLFRIFPCRSLDGEAGRFPRHRLPVPIPLADALHCCRQRPLIPAGHDDSQLPTVQELIDTGAAKGGDPSLYGLRIRHPATRRRGAMQPFRHPRLRSCEERAGWKAAY